MASQALILVDFENEWITEDSEYYVGDISAVISNTNRLIDHCRKAGYKIIFIRHVEKDSEKEFAGKRADIIDSVHKKDTDTIITKYSISPFYKTSLEDELKDTKDIVVCGILTNLCVRSLVHDAYDRDFDITVIKDCCVSFDEATQEFTFRDIKETREEIQFKNTEEFIK